MILSVLKAVTVKARVIVLEDLCGQLPEYETERLRQICEKVKKKGIGILGVTNQLNSRTPIYEELSVIKNQVTVRTFSKRETRSRFSGCMKKEQNCRNQCRIFRGNRSRSFWKRKDSGLAEERIFPLFPSGCADRKYWNPGQGMEYAAVVPPRAEGRD